MATPAIFTVGYENTPQAEVIETIKAAGVDLVIDVRAVASSRRAGFSKTILGNSLTAMGIDYLHLRDLGTPKPGRDAARKGHIAEMTAIFEEHLQTPAAGLALERAIAESQERKVCLLCYEADAAGCHRRIVAHRMVERTGAEVIDL